MDYRNGGYCMVDCTGLDLTDSNEQTITGLYARMKAALKTGKPLVAYGCVWGTNSDAPLTPIQFFAQEWSSSLIVGTASILNISVTSADKVTVVDLTAST